MTNEILEIALKTDFFNADSLEVQPVKHTANYSTQLDHSIKIKPKNHELAVLNIGEFFGISFLDLKTFESQLNEINFRINTIFWHSDRMEIRVYKFK